LSEFFSPPNWTNRKKIFVRPFVRYLPDLSIPRGIQIFRQKKAFWYFFPFSSLPLCSFHDFISIPAIITFYFSTSSCKSSHVCSIYPWSQILLISTRHSLFFVFFFLLLFSYFYVDFLGRIFLSSHFDNRLKRESFQLSFKFKTNFFDQSKDIFKERRTELLGGLRAASFVILHL
jgi:hypothetical protein